MQYFNEISDLEPLKRLSTAAQPGALAIVVGIEGPSYRPLGAMMAIFQNGERVGSLSSGCVEADITLHAQQALETQTFRTVKYGKGSPYRDIQLPCGGGLEILIIPQPDVTVLSNIVDAHGQRKTCALVVDSSTQEIFCDSKGQTGFHGDQFVVELVPEFRFVVFGKGPEAIAFSSLVQSVGYSNLVLSPDEETLARAAVTGCPTHHLKIPTIPDHVYIDERTAIVLFFHDHEWEPPIIKAAVTSKAFYIGAQGSRRTSDTRRASLSAMGLNAEDLDRVKGPIGLIPSVRDARTLAVSVLAEVLAVTPLTNAVQQTKVSEKV